MINPPIFYGSMVEVDAQGFVDEVFKVLDAMGVTSQEKSEVATYQLKDVTPVWYEQWKDERQVIKVTIPQETSRWLSLIGYFPCN